MVVWYSNLSNFSKIIQLKKLRLFSKLFYLVVVVDFDFCNFPWAIHALGILILGPYAVCFVPQIFADKPVLFNTLFKTFLFNIKSLLNYRNMVILSKLVEFYLFS